MAVVRGKYAKFGFGTFVQDCGNVMCTVKVEGDSRATRNLWKSSLAVVVPPTKDPTKDGNAGNDNDNRGEDMLPMKRTDYDELLQEVNDLSDEVKKLKSKIKNADG